MDHEPVPAAGGGAVIKFTIPFIAGSAGFDTSGNPLFTTNGLAAYDPGTTAARQVELVDAREEA